MPTLRPASSLVRTTAAWRACLPLDGTWLAICALVLGLEALPAPVAEALVYDRAAIATGQLWRVVTGHVVHLGWTHAWLNAGCLAACAWLAGRAAGGVRTLAALACGTGALLWVGVPSVARYAGLSGVVYGAAAYALIAVAGRRMPAWVALAALAALAVRVGRQWLGGAPAADAAWLGGPVAPAAHVAGCVAGVLWACVGKRGCA